MSFSIARTIDDALAALAGGARPVAGGSDLVVAARHGKAPLPEALVAIDRLSELATIVRTNDGLRIGALATHAMLMADPLVVAMYTGVADACALVGSPSTRNVGTIGGNVMNSSPAMDTGAPLLVLDARIELRSLAATRTLPIAELWLAPGRNVAGPDELCTAVLMPLPPPRSGSAYVRLEYRRAMEIAVVGAGALVGLNDDGTLNRISVALTAVAPTIIALDGLEDLSGRTIDDALLAIVADRASQQCTPITDLRATDNYRRHCVGVMASRAVHAAARRAAGDVIGVPVNRSIGIGAAR
jgi:CO/xanthine dehydrogenase FAD-binding subunit